MISVLALSTMALVGGAGVLSAGVGTQQAATIDTRLEDVHAQIVRAEFEDERATDDFVKTLIAVRLAILRNTEAMLEQKKIAREQGITLTYAVEGAVYRPEPPAPELIAGLEAAIAGTETQVDVARAKAATYSDRAARSTAAASVAILENTLAMLWQRWYAATYSIPYILADVVAEPEAAAAPAAPAAATPAVPVPRSRPPTGGGVEMVEINLRITDTTTTWWEMSWWLTLRNVNDEDVRVNATIQFLDEDGRVVDEDEVPDLRLLASQQQVFRGASRIDARIAPRVKSVYAKIRYIRD
jgi:hypothetical protein